MTTLTRTLPPPDTFVQNLDGCIEAHLSDASLNVKRLLRLVGMSRTDLHRKLDRTVGMSTTEYVRNKRLEKAAELLREQPEWSVSQVAQEVGFGNQSYFTVRFKEVFGCCPGAWRERLEHL
ncbi:MAG: helix-turn-helix transcriptional regulator [Bacteroidetes bacterium]|nr:helix-turn-helix transcriptional regulator [Bacteroidota bacterium]